MADTIERREGMSTQKTLAFDEDGLYVETLPKEEIPTVFYGTDDPDEKITAKKGDLYIKIASEEA